MNNLGVWEDDINAIKWPDDIEIENVQSSIYGTYNTSASSYSIEQAILGNSGAIYYGVYGGASTTIFSREEPDRNYAWAKSYSPHSLFHRGVALTSDEEFIFSIDDANDALVNILKINASDGSLLMKYEE